MIVCGMLFAVFKMSLIAVRVLDCPAVHLKIAVDLFQYSLLFDLLPTSLLSV